MSHHDHFDEFQDAPQLRGHFEEERSAKRCMFTTFCFPLALGLALLKLSAVFVFVLVVLPAYLVRSVCAVICDDEPAELIVLGPAPAAQTPPPPPVALPLLPTMVAGSYPIVATFGLQIYYMNVRLSAMPALPNRAASTLLLPGEMIHGRIELEAPYGTDTEGSPPMCALRLTCTERLYTYVKTSTTQGIVLDTVHFAQRSNSREHYSVDVPVHPDGRFSVVIPSGAPPTFSHPEVDGSVPENKRLSSHFVAQVSHELVFMFDSQLREPGRIPLLVASSPEGVPPEALQPVRLHSRASVGSLCGANRGEQEACVTLPHAVALRPSSRAPGWLHPAVGVHLDGARSGATAVSVVCEITTVENNQDKQFAIPAQTFHVVSRVRVPGMPLRPRSAAAGPGVGASGLDAAGPAPCVSLTIPSTLHTFSTRLYSEPPLLMPVSFRSAFFDVSYHLVVELGGMGIDAGRVWMVPITVTDNPHALARAQRAVGGARSSPAADVGVVVSVGTGAAKETPPLHATTAGRGQPSVSDPPGGRGAISVVRNPMLGPSQS